MLNPKIRQSEKRSQRGLDCAEEDGNDEVLKQTAVVRAKNHTKERIDRVPLPLFPQYQAC